MIILDTFIKRRFTGGLFLKYTEACSVLNDAARLGSKPGLHNITRLCAMLGDPQDKLKIIHVAGTNGKGSTCRMLAQTGQEAGYKTGLFSSPFLEDYRDSFSINGAAVSKKEFAGAMQEVSAQARIMEAEGAPPTEYEMLTACAFLWFFRQGCDLVVLETCMGGRLDVTNVIKKPLACIICTISLDHTAFLGNTPLQIAAEKCGIVKQGCPVVAYPKQPRGVLDYIRKTAREKGCPFIVPQTGRIQIISADLFGTDFVYAEDTYRTAMPGEHQVLNAAVAIETAHTLTKQTSIALSEHDVRQGIQKARLPARQEVLAKDPLLLLDGAHNPEGIRALSKTIERHLHGKKIVVVMGMLSDKQTEQSISMMAQLCDTFIAVAPQSLRALDPQITAQTAKKYCAAVYSFKRISGALKKAVCTAGRGGAVVICGSLYLYPAVRRILKGKNSVVFGSLL
jgi:dihydrofolate synthase/folylpolyglutamate synthase